MKPAASQALSQKPSAPAFDKPSKVSTADKDTKASKEPAPKMDNFTPAGSNQFRSSSKDIKQASLKNINKEPMSGKKGKRVITQTPRVRTLRFT